MQHPSYNRPVQRFEISINRLFVLTLVLGLAIPSANATGYPVAARNWQSTFLRSIPHKPRTPAKRGPPEELEERVPLVVTNQCDTKIWPGIATQSGTGPGIGGFELATNESRNL
ncbi:hypothetical protein PT974_09316 [Cladobotryum mycophilum]|uniref:Uncharacterized protein n=1 Tax=Cladobotryum mycophilum TaxID=491253 RepID=A0ABR0SH37_9HYPO